MRSRRSATDRCRHGSCPLHRQGREAPPGAALIALERIGTAKSDKVLPAVTAALASEDQDEVVAKRR